ncbi:MAG: HypC/HybG/HupF family hydrogenase formation chaperone [Burkholderiales bacterium]|jgi:hydrogenase expression/formation protein HypC|nr:HypC/HybG/HupF family hydrogenase formation chaperone [Burkholderiales bacterium]
MCLGIPMQILESREGFAVCDRGGEKIVVNMMLTGALPVGTWIMTFQNSAIKALTEDEARQTLAALSALSDAINGDTSNLNAYFPDLVAREPILPDHLKAAAAKSATLK